MSMVFTILSVLATCYLAWNLLPAGFKKVTDVSGPGTTDTVNLPTFTSLFGKLGFPVLLTVGLTELFGPIFLGVATAINDPFTNIFAGLIALVMFGAATVHIAIWKNSPKQPLTLFAVTLLTILFHNLAVQTKPVVEVQSVLEVVADTTVVDSTKVDTLPGTTDTVPE